MITLPDEFELADRTLGRVLSMAAAEARDKPLVVDVAGESISYAAAERRANQIGHGLRDLGVAYREPVLFMLRDTIELLLLVFGIAKRGAVQVPINLAYRGSFLSHIINDSGAHTLVIDAEYLERLAAVAEELPHLRRCVIYPRVPHSVPAGVSKNFELVSFDALSSTDHSALTEGPKFNDLAGIMYTSGTTGPSKGVMVCHAHAYRYANNVGAQCAAADRFYTAGLPLFHIAGQWAVCYRALMRGATIILRRGYKNQYFWKDIRDHDATMTSLLGTIANFIWQQPRQPDDADNPLQRAGIYPVIADWQAFSERFDVKLWTTYGSTESPPPCLHYAGEPFPDLRYVGDLKDSVECKILDPQDAECEVGTVGEICVRPRNPWELTLGYWQRPQATADAFRNLWFHTGDSGYVDDQDRLYFVDRVSDSMRRRGENVSSMEVESIVNEHPYVLDSAAFGVWADETEQEIMVTLTVDPAHELDPQDLIRFLETRMPYFMVPRYVDVVTQMEKTPTGKIRKNELRRRGVSASTWDRVKAGVRLER